MTENRGMDEQIEALAEIMHDAFHAPRLGLDFDAWLAKGYDPERPGFALPWVLEPEDAAKDNFRRAAKAALDHLGANHG